jgi:hypothetical protein
VARIKRLANIMVVLLYMFPPSLGFTGFSMLNKVRCRKVPERQNKLKIKWLVGPNLPGYAILVVIDGIFVCE